MSVEAEAIDPPRDRSKCYAWSAVNIPSDEELEQAWAPKEEPVSANATVWCEENRFIPSGTRLVGILNEPSGFLGRFAHVCLVWPSSLQWLQWISLRGTLLEGAWLFCDGPVDDDWNLDAARAMPWLMGLMVTLSWLVVLMVVKDFKRVSSAKRSERALYKLGSGFRWTIELLICSQDEEPLRTEISKSHWTLYQIGQHNMKMPSVTLDSIDLIFGSFHCRRAIHISFPNCKFFAALTVETS